MATREQLINMVYDKADGDFNLDWITEFESALDDLITSSESDAWQAGYEAGYEAGYDQSVLDHHG